MTMSIITNPRYRPILTATIGRRLRVARKAAGKSMEEASEVIGQKGIAQISLWESGKRMITLEALVQLADFYGVAVDFLLGRLDDQDADPSELNSAMLAGSVTNTIRRTFDMFTGIMAQQCQAALMHRRFDREQLGTIVSLGTDLKKAVERFAELNPSFEEDMRGGARLMSAVQQVSTICELVTIRHQREEEITQLLAEEQAAVLKRADPHTLSLL